MLLRRFVNQGRSLHIALLGSLLLLSRGMVFLSAEEVAWEYPAPASRNILPYNDRRIDYLGHPLPADLQLQLERAISSAQNDSEPLPRLKTLLQALEISVESQVLVYSKTSTNGKLVSLENPRAIYFNERLILAWVPGAEFFELLILNPEVGSQFLTIPTRSGLTSPNSTEWTRERRCLQCHVAGETLGVPGLLLKSVAVNETGTPLKSLLSDNANSEWKHQWGGWYVSDRNFSSAAKLIEADFAQSHLWGRYPSHNSDSVALLILRHLTRLNNLLIRYRYEHLLGLPLSSETSLVFILLRGEEIPQFPPLVRTPYAKVWERSRNTLNPSESQFRKLNLKDRLFEARISPELFGENLSQLSSSMRHSLGLALQREFSEIPPRSDFYSPDIKLLIQERIDEFLNAKATKSSEQPEKLGK